MRVMSGTKEHLIQSGTIAMPRSSSEEIIVKPIIVEDNAAGTILAALQLRWEQLQVHPLQLGTSAELVFVSVCIDAHSSNLKICRFFRKALPTNIILHMNICVLHALARINDCISKVRSLMAQGVCSASPSSKSVDSA